MHFTFATLALLASSSYASAQGVTALLTPTASAPASCATDYAGSFEITPYKLASKRNVVVEKRDTLVLSLKGSVLTDAQGRIGDVVANHQFQFDGPPAQTGAIYTGGFSICSNNSLALGGSTIFYQCLSGSFYNLYDESIGNQCIPVELAVSPAGSASQAGDGQPTAASAASQQSDGQPTAASAAVTQISDGQVQATSAAAPMVSQISDGQIQATTPAAAPVSQISDGQIQATTAASPLSQISDGQIQATTAASPVSQIPDGQVEATTAASPVSQISDGQVQATTAAWAPVSQISDGQVQAATTMATQASAAPVSQVSDGQIQASGSGGMTTTSAAASALFTGAAVAPKAGSWAALAVAGVGFLVVV